MMATPTITLNHVTTALDQRGLKYKIRGRYIVTQCPIHHDRQPSCQIYLNDWFMLCHVCGRMPVQQALPELKGETPITYTQPLPPKPLYKHYELIDYWRELDELPKDFTLKSLPQEVFHDLGWRINDGKVIAGVGDIFIPYFSRSRQSIPFAQVRHLSGERRFTFLQSAKPTCYGTWNLYPGDKIFIVEGTSDCAVLDYCAVPWIGIPSSSGGELIKSLAKWCWENDCGIVYGGDNDEAGNKLKMALGETAIPFRSSQPPKEYNDYAEFYEKAGFDAVVDYTHAELFN